MGAEEEQPQQVEAALKAKTAFPTLTESQFLSWKRQKDAAELTRKDDAARKRAEDIAAGTVKMNGRELFLHEPSVFDNSIY